MATVFTTLSTGCATQKKVEEPVVVHNTARESSSLVKVFLSPENLTQGDYQSILTGLVRSKRFLIVDRSAGLNAGEREKAFQHLEGGEVGYKLAKKKKLEGAGGVIIASQNCFREVGMLEVVMNCQQTLSLYDVSSARLLHSVEVNTKGNTMSWRKVTAQLASEIPDLLIAEEIPLHMQEETNPVHKWQNEIAPEENRTPASLEN